MGCVILHNMLLPEPRVEQDYYDEHATALLDDPEFATEVERVRLQNTNQIPKRGENKFTILS